MKISIWYKEFFEKYYLPFFAKKKTNLDTEKEVLFIKRSLKLRRGAKILDLGCGFCRHGIELARDGFKVTGLDLNTEFLKIAKKISVKDKVKIRFVRSDMRKFSFEDKFDAVISMFTSFGYFEKNEDNAKVLKAIVENLRPRGLLLLDLQNKKWVLENVHKKNWKKIDDTYVLESRFFNDAKGIFGNDIILIKSKDKIEKTHTYNHLYDSEEIKGFLKKVGLKISKVFGDYNFCEYNKNSSPRMIILARKIS